MVEIIKASKIFRFWNHDVLQNVEGVLEMILKIQTSAAVRITLPNPSHQGRGYTVRRGYGVILAWLIIILLVGGLAAWLADRQDSSAARWISLSALAFDCVLLAFLWSDSTTRVALDRGPGLSN